MQLDPSCSTELLPRVAKYQLSFTVAPTQAMCGILFLFPTTGKGPLVKKFKGNNLLYIHFKLLFILSLPCKNNLVSPFEKKWCNCSKPKRLLVHPRESFPLPEGSAGGMCSLTADHSLGGVVLFSGCFLVVKEGSCSSGPKQNFCISSTLFVCRILLTQVLRRRPMLPELNISWSKPI